MWMWIVATSNLYGGSIMIQKLNYSPLTKTGASLVAQLVKNPPAIWETWVQSLGWEYPLEKGKATHFSILAWRIPWTVWGRKESDTTEQLLYLLNENGDRTSFKGIDLMSRAEKGLAGHPCRAKWNEIILEFLEIFALTHSTATRFYWILGGRSECCLFN